MCDGIGREADSAARQLLLFDEATSALDNRTRVVVTASLRKMKTRTTRILVRIQQACTWIWSCSPPYLPGWRAGKRREDRECIVFAMAASIFVGCAVKN